VVTTTSGTGTYTLGAAVDGFHTPAIAGLISGRRYTYLATNSIGTGGAATQWERGYGVLTNTSGVWTLTRVIRKNKDGGNTAINWQSGNKWIALISDADDLNLYDTDGWMQVGGDRTRNTAAPLDVLGQNGSGQIATFGNGAGANRLIVADDAITGVVPFRTPLPVGASDVATKAYTDAAPGSKIKVVSGAWNAPAGGLGFDPSVAETIFIPAITIPAKTTQIMMGLNIQGAQPAGSASIYARVYVLSPNQTIIWGPYGTMVSASAGQFPNLGKMIFCQLASGVVNTEGFTLRVNLYRDNPINVLGVDLTAICICEG
jgi:hypothetical protein